MSIVFFPSRNFIRPTVLIFETILNMTIIIITQLQPFFSYKRKKSFKSLLWSSKWVIYQFNCIFQMRETKNTYKYEPNHQIFKKIIIIFIHWAYLGFILIFKFAAMARTSSWNNHEDELSSKVLAREGLIFP